MARSGRNAIVSNVPSSITTRRSAANSAIPIAQEAHQIDQRSSETVNGPCGHDLDLPLGDGLQETIISGSLVAALGAGDAFVGEDVDDLPAGFLGDILQDEKLVLDRLLIGADPDVEGGFLGQPNSPAAAMSLIFLICRFTKSS